jgi:hypothetical protein
MSLASSGGGGLEMELFRQQVATWRARSAKCLTLLLAHGLRVNDVCDRRRASTLLHVAARYDLVDVIEMLMSYRGSSEGFPDVSEDLVYLSERDGRDEVCSNKPAAVKTKRKKMKKTGPACKNTQQQREENGSVIAGSQDAYLHTETTDVSQHTRPATTGNLFMEPPYHLQTQPGDVHGAHNDVTHEASKSASDLLICGELIHSAQPHVERRVVTDDDDDDDVSAAVRDAWAALPGDDVSAVWQLRRAVGRRARAALGEWRHHHCLGLGMGRQARKNRLCQHAQDHHHQLQHKARHSHQHPHHHKGHHSLQPTPAEGNSEVLADTSQPQHADPLSHRGAKCGLVDDCLPNLEAVNGTGKTPLLVAVDRGTLRAAHCLLAHGADVTASDLYGRSLLHLLAERDVAWDLLLSHVLRAGGVAVWRRDLGGSTALHVAAYMGQAAKAQLILAAGGSPDTRNAVGRSPLYQALQRRNPAAKDTILLFLLASVDVPVRDRQGGLPLLLQTDDNAPCRRRLEALGKEGDSLLRRCVVTVRRALGVVRMLHMTSWHALELPCPQAVLRAVWGEEEREIVEALRI